SGKDAGRPAPPHRGDALALQRARRGSVAGRAAGDDSGARRVLGDRLRPGAGRSKAERITAVHDGDRRSEHPLHSRALAARERGAADHDARLAGLCHGDDRLRRPADGPDRARRQRRGCLPPRTAVPARVRLLGRAGRGLLGPWPDRTGLGRAHAPPRLHPLRGLGRRRGRRRHRRDGPPGTRGADRHPHEPARAGAERHHADGHRRGTRRSRADRHLPAVRKRLLRRDGHPAADDRIRPAGFTGRPRGRMVDHDTDAYYKIARAFVDAEPSGNLTRDNVLDNITTYWLTGTGASTARSYWEAYGPDAPAAGRQPLPPPPIPVGFTTFPGEIWRTPRSWVEKSYPNVIYFNEVDRGGHFAAWEEPELFSTEVRAAFRPLR